MKKYLRPQFCFMAFASIIATVLLMAFTQAEVARTEKGELEKSLKAMPGDCAFCHQNKIQLPTNHPQTREMSLDQCNQCHHQQINTLAGKIPLSHFHLLAGVSCEDCHDKTASAQSPKTKVCLQCHGTFHEIADRTNDMDPNPHSSHLGSELDCHLCHRLHKKSENLCKRCHEYEWNIP